MTQVESNWFSKQLDAPTSGFCGKLSSPKVLLQVLKVLNFREDVLVNVGPNGLKITAEVSKSFQASAFIQRETFLEYSVSEATQREEEDIIFNVSLPTLINCLNLCGTGNTTSGASGFLLNTTNNPFMNTPSSSMILYYSEIGQPLRVWIEEDGIISGATIPTMDGADTLSFDDAHHNSNVVARIIMLTEFLKDVIQDIDSKCDHVEFVMCPVTKVFSMSTYDPTVNFCVEIPFDSEIVSHSEVNEYICVRYQLSLLRHALKPISMAEKVSIRIDAKKLLSIQYMIQLNDDTKSYMEFYCAPDIDMD